MKTHPTAVLFFVLSTFVAGSAWAIPELETRLEAHRATHEQIEKKSDERKSHRSQWFGEYPTRYQEKK